MEFTVVLTFERITCCECGAIYMLANDFVRQRRRDHHNFYCPNGHPQHWPGESEEERLRRVLHETTLAKERAEREREAAWQAEQATAATNAKLERAVKKAKVRAMREAAGVCPCCPRTFVNLQRHIAGQHPEYAVEHGINLAKAIQVKKEKL